MKSKAFTADSFRVQEFPLGYPNGFPFLLDFMKQQLVLNRLVQLSVPKLRIESLKINEFRNRFELFTSVEEFKLDFQFSK